MCGISGFLNRDTERPADRALLARMTDVIAHRGPDGSGHFVQGPVALGHRRLAIIDLSENGAQPMVDRDLRLTVVFNGCVYNYRELRAELIKVGYRFASRSDTEVIAKAYHRWGTACVERFYGMFAFAV